MTFTYNFDTHTLESDDPNVFVKVAGKSPQQGTYFALYMRDKRIGFASNYHWRSEQSEVRADGTVVWRITELGCALYTRQAYIGGGMDEDIAPYRFEDEVEQDRVLDIILDAVSAYPGIPDLSRYGEEPKFVEGTPSAVVEFTEGLKLLVDRGALLKDATPFRYNRETQKIECDDPTIFVRYVPGFRDEGAGFVLHFSGKRVGFLTAFYDYKDRTEKLADGTLIWRIGEIGTSVRANASCGVDAPTSPYRFTDQDEMWRAMKLLKQALVAYKGRLTFVTGEETGLAQDQGACLVEFWPEVMKKAEAGEYLQ